MPGKGVARAELAAAIRACTFSGATLWLDNSFTFLDGGSLTGTTAEIYRQRYGPPVVIENMNATGNTANAPFNIRTHNAFFGSGNVIQGNLYPVKLTGGGVYPGSTMPATGNINNYVYVPEAMLVGRAHFSKHALDYVIDHNPNVVQELGGNLTIEPGVNLRFTPGAYLWATFGSDIDAFGTPEKPITFMPHIPGTKWLTWNFAVNGSRTHPRHCIVTGSELGLIADETQVHVDSSLFENNTRGLYTSNFGSMYVRGSRVFDNTTGIGASAVTIGSGFINANGLTNPNWFEGNGVAVTSLSSLNHQAQNNYWGHPSGPKHTTQNPGGQGDTVIGLVQVAPWLSSPPQTTDAPPRVRVMPVSFYQEAGKKLILSWRVEDEAPLVAQRVWFSGHSVAVPLAVLKDGIDPAARSAVIDVPNYVVSSSIDPPVIRVECVDQLGQSGWDEVMFFTPNLDFTTSVIPDPIAGPLKPGHEGDICYQVQPGASGTTDFTLFLDGDSYSVSQGGAHTGIKTCLNGWLDIPAASTDLARLGIRYNHGAGGRNVWKFSPYFSIRPDAAIGDAPPQVMLTSPVAGATYHAGQAMNIAWNASDDDEVRFATVQVSTDAGTTWDTIAQEITGSTYQWKVPENSGIADVRARVIVHDHRFQNSSSTIGPFSIDNASFCYADCDASGSLDFFDFLCFQNEFAAKTAYADCDMSGSHDFFDFLCFQNAFAAGCP